MNEYTPEKWQVVRIKGDKFPTTYKVFACWYGGYLNGDSWKMNSGIKSAKKVGEYWVFEGFSGSVYNCHAERYGTNMYGQRILDDFIKKAKEQDVTMWVMPEGLDWSKFDYDKE